MVDLESNMKKYRRMFEEALSSPEAWMDGPIVEFTEDLCRLMKEKGTEEARVAGLARRRRRSRRPTPNILWPVPLAHEYNSRQFRTGFRPQLC